MALYDKLFKKMNKEPYPQLKQYFKNMNLVANTRLIKWLMIDFFEKGKVKPRWKRKVENTLSKFLSITTEYQRLEQMRVDKYFLFIDLLRDKKIIPKKEIQEIKKLKAQLGSTRVFARDALLLDLKNHNASIITWNSYLDVVRKKLVNMINQYAPLKAKTY